MKKIYFFKAKSRIGIKNKPNHQDEFNIGVEDAPEGILSAGFLANFPESKMSSFEFPKPEDISEADFNKILANSIKDFKNRINLEISHSARNDSKIIQIVVGGDHIVTLPSILADLERVGDPSKIGIVHIDSHADINLSKDSPTGNFHGMYLRPLFDHFDINEIDQLVPNKIPTENLMMIGNLDLDSGETKFIKAKNIKTASLLDIRKKDFPNKFKKFINQFEHLHISFDIDCLDKTIAPATGIPAENGLLWEDLEPVLLEIKKNPSFSFDLCEVNPRKPGGEETVKLARDILKVILG